MYNKESAQFIDLNASTELAGAVSVKQSQQIDFICLFLYPLQTLFVMGYTVFTLSVCASVRASVRACVRLSVRNVLFF